MKAELTAFEEYAAIGNLRDRERIVRLVDRFMEISPATSSSATAADCASATTREMRRRASSSGASAT